MPSHTFTFKRFFKDLDLPADEQSLIEDCLHEGVETFCREDRRERWWSDAELLAKPYVFGYGAVAVVRHPSLSAPAKYKVAVHAMQAADPVADNGVPHGLAILLSYLAGLGALDVVMFTSAMHIAHIGGHVFEGSRLDEILTLVDWLIIKADLSDSDRLWWLYYILANNGKIDFGKVIIAHCVRHPILTPAFKRDLCYAFLDRRATLTPPAHWRVLRAMMHGDEEALNQALGELDPQTAALYQTDAEPPTPPQPRADAPPPSFGFIRSLLTDDFYFLGPYLKKQAVLGLAKVGEDIPTLCDAYLGKHDFDTAAINEGVAEVLRLHRSAVPDNTVRGLIERGLGIGDVATRRAFYELGAEFFGSAYWERAAADNAKSIRDWAAKRLSGESEPKKRGRKQRQIA